MKCFKIPAIIKVKPAIIITMSSYQDISLAVTIGNPDKIIA